MKYSRLLLLGLGAAFAASACGSDEPAGTDAGPAVAPQPSRVVTAEDGRVQYIVRFADRALDAMPRSAAVDARFAASHTAPAVHLVQALEREYGVTAEYMTSHVGVSLTAYLTPAQAAALARDARVEAVTPDEYVQFSAPVWADGTGTGVGSQHVSWGATAVSSGPAAAATRVYVIDGGVTPNATELNLELPERNAYCLHNETTPQCVNPAVVGCYAHPTHVAGIIGARDNTSGSRGVAPGVTVISVSALDPTHVMGGCLSDGNMTSNAITQALDWIATDVAAHSTAGVGIVNISINGQMPGTSWGPTGSVSVAMRNAATPHAGYAGVFIAQSAGNLFKSACAYGYAPAAPATGAIATDGIMVVGNLNAWGQQVQPLNGVNGERNGSLAGSEPGSNYGPCVDAWAPGNRIFSAWAPAGTYVYLSGTSMAAPHIAGLAARLASTAATPAALEAAVRSHLVALGSVDTTMLPISMPTLAPPATAYSTTYAEVAATVDGVPATVAQEVGYTFFADQLFTLLLQRVGPHPSTVRDCGLAVLAAGATVPTHLGNADTLNLPHQHWAPGTYSVYSPNCPTASTTIAIVPRLWMHFFLDHLELPVNGTLSIGQGSPSVFRYQADYAGTCNLDVRSWANGQSLPGYPQNNHGVAANVPLPTMQGNYDVKVACTSTVGDPNFTFTFSLYVGPRTDNSQIVYQWVPTTVARGATFWAGVEVRNQGNVAWTPGELYRLGSYPHDNTVWGQSRLLLDAGDQIEHGETKEFGATFTAPTVPGTYTFDWQMLREGVQWFGPVASATITVTP